MVAFQAAFLLLLAAQAVLVVRNSRGWKLESAVTAGFVLALLLAPPDGDWELMETAVRVYVAVGVAPLAERALLRTGASRETLEDVRAPRFWAAAAACALLAALIARVPL
ncbi:hypothetical protein GCM10010387_51340 [Streptomyces inusitatus]|uniref:Uncharacterized protein n=1 Tax=Streptomyces inusitatus TaxID=68221 RepID=A0A918V0L9_9ACTN|nr:hypothetical protein [Streptomyces inusitatus]GGZ50762.1 hypothetical protein GCM10010387_51340 [Streptomyces inusitatus]